MAFINDNAVEISRRYRPRTPIRLISAFMLFFAIVLGGIWIAMSLGTVFTGQPPAVLERFDHPTSVVFALDLGILIPGMILGALLLWRRRPWGYVLGAIMNIKAFTYSVVLIVSTFYAIFTTGIGDPLLPMYALLGAGNLVASALLLGNIKKDRSITPEKPPPH